MNTGYFTLKLDEENRTKWTESSRNSIITDESFIVNMQQSKFELKLEKFVSNETN